MVMMTVMCNYNLAQILAIIDHKNINESQKKTGREWYKKEGFKL